MQAVEIAHRQHAAARMVRGGSRMSDDADHDGAIRRNFMCRRPSAKIARQGAPA
jgi:hypothetical protein